MVKCAFFLWHIGLKKMSTDVNLPDPHTSKGTKKDRKGGKEMKASILTAMTATALILVISSPAWAGDPFKKVQGRQINRIAGGVESGEITHNEHFNLKQEQKRIQRARRRALADGRLSQNERRRLRHMQDQASEHIYKAKHNRRRNDSRLKKWSDCNKRTMDHDSRVTGYDGARYEKRPAQDRHYKRLPLPGGFSVSGAWVFPEWAFSIATGGKW